MSRNLRGTNRYLTCGAILIALTGCDDPGSPNDFTSRCAALDRELGVPRPAGWTHASHCKHAPADVGVVFPAEHVTTLAIKMTAEEYAAMQADFVELSEEVPSEPGDFNPETPCVGHAVNEPCEIDVGSGLEPGVCVELLDSLGCFPDSWRAPDEWVEACAGKAEGDDCSTSTHDSRCLSDGVEVACLPPPEGPGPEPCAGKADGDACTQGASAGSCRRTTGPLICQADDYDVASVDDVPIEAAVSFWPRDPKYFHADVEFAGATFTSVGIRYKGNHGLASSPGEKKPLRLKLDKWEKDFPAVTDQRLFGFQDLSLAPNHTNPSNLHQVLASAVFREYGVPAPHAGFVEVTLDTGSGPRLLGLYALTEIPDAPLLERAFASHDGNLYKPDGRGAHLLAFVHGSFHKESNEGSGYDDVQAFLDALHGSRANRPAWRQRLAQHFDMDGFADFYAINQAIGNWDTYGRLAHNYYLYADDNARLRFVPWDFDLAFDGTGANDLTLRSFDGRWPLLQALARDVALATRYQASLRAFAESELASGKLAQRIDALAVLVRPAVLREDAVRSGVAQAFDDGLGALRKHVTAQRAAIDDFLGSQRNRHSASPRLLEALRHGPDLPAKQRWRVAMARPN